MEICDERRTKRKKRGKRTLRAVKSSGGTSGLARQCLVDQHHRYVGDDGIHEVRLLGVQPLGHDRLFVAELLAVFLDEGPARLVGELDELERTFRLRTDENGEKLGIDGHREQFNVIPRSEATRIPSAFCGPELAN